MRSFSPNARRTLWVGLGLVALTVAAYWPVLASSFVNWDDNVVVYDNPHVATGVSWNNFVWSWGIHAPSQWHPLAWWTHQLDCQLFRLSAPRHHGTNLLFHMAGVIALFVAIKRLTGEFWPSAVVAALFAVHPIGVESVAWIAERRDVLCGVFFALTLAAYATYVQRGCAGRYALVALWLTLGLMSKPMLVTVPCVLLLLDYWPLKRTESFGRLALEKLPLLALSAVSATLSFLCEREIWKPAQYPLAYQVGNALNSYALYLRNVFWPWRLTTIYPLPETLDTSQVIVSASVLVSITVVAVWLARRSPYLLVGWLWYLGMLVPVIGLQRVGVAVALADHWAYLPLIGIYLALVWGARDLAARWSIPREALAALAVALLAVCGGLTIRQTGFWHNGVTLFARAVQLAPTSAEAHNNLGNALQSQQDTVRALAEFRRALELNPKYVEAHNNLGIALRNTGETTAAIESYRAALQLKRDYAPALNNLGVALQSLNRTDEAIACYRQAVDLKPDDAEAHNNLGSALQNLGQIDEALGQYQVAVRLKPDMAGAHYNLGTAYKHLGQTGDALAEFRIAQHLTAGQANVPFDLRAALQGIGQTDILLAGYRDEVSRYPRSASAHNNLGVALRDAGRHNDAANEFRAALTLNPEFAEVYNNLGATMQSLGRPAEAEKLYREALTRRPDFAPTHYNLGNSLRNRGQLDEAIHHYREALRLKPQYADALNGLGVVLAQLGRVQEAAESFRAALAVEPHNGAAQKNLRQAESMLKPRP